MGTQIGRQLPDEVRAISKKIRANAEHDWVPTTDVDDELEFSEGRILTAMHVRRERKPLLRKALLASRLKLGELACEGCGWQSGAIDSSIASAAFEAHHLRPLAEIGVSSTKIKDLVLLCATCHRLVHRHIGFTGNWLSKAGIKDVVAPARHAPTNIGKSG